MCFCFFFFFFLSVEHFAEDTPVKSIYNQNITIQVSNNVLHQISSHVFGILAREKLNYNVIYEDIQLPQDNGELNETLKLFYTLEQIETYVCIWFIFDLCAKMKIITQLYLLLLWNIVLVHIDQY